MQSENVIINIEDVNIYQNKNLILKSVYLKVCKSEFIYLIGKTGTGKTSLLRSLYGDLPITQGNAEITGFNLLSIKRREIPFLRRKLGIIFQDFQLLTDRTVKENMLFVMKATGWSDKIKMESRIMEVLTLVGLKTKDYKMPFQLSGGEQQRTVIARALINEPEVILADEPTGNLDPETSEGILKLLMDISSNGTAVLMATHNYPLLEKFPARIIKCENGQLINIESLTSESISV